MRVACVAALAAAVLAGCAAGSRAQDASRAAARFLDAAGRGDGGSACALLVPRTREDLGVSQGQPCDRSLPLDRLHGTIQGADVWSGWAKVSTDAGALFLTEFESGWLITAAGCRSDGEAPYQCVVGG
jgi:hypothetical protein